MPASPWGLVGEDLFDALFAHLERDDKVLAKARLVNRHWRQLVDASISEIEPRQRVTEPNLSQLLRRFRGLTSVNVGEPWRMRITDESIPALLVTSPNRATVACASVHLRRRRVASMSRPLLLAAVHAGKLCVCHSLFAVGHEHAPKRIALVQGLTRLQALDVTPLLSNEGLMRLEPLAGKLTALQYAGHAAGRSGGLSDGGAQFIGQV